MGVQKHPEDKSSLAKPQPKPDAKTDQKFPYTNPGLTDKELTPKKNPPIAPKGPVKSWD